MLITVIGSTVNQQVVFIVQMHVTLIFYGTVYFLTSFNKWGSAQPFSVYFVRFPITLLLQNWQHLLISPITGKLFLNIVK
jgi:hypothetical protein